MRMIGGALDRLLHRKLRQLPFPQQRGEPARVRTRAIVEAFLAGAHGGCLLLPAALMAAAEREVPWYDRTFFWEGYAAGLAALHACSLSHGTPDRRNQARRHRVMQYTGYGFWNGLARMYHLPEVDLSPGRWADSPDFHRLSPFVAGGMGFSAACIAGAPGPALFRRLRCAPRSEWERAALHGCGRALWFLYMDNYEGLEEVLAAHPQHRIELLEGIGVAITFTGIVEPDQILAAIERFAAPARPVLTRGVGACLQAMTEDDPDNEARIGEIRQSELHRAFEVGRRAARETTSETGWYWTATERLRSAFP